MKELIKLSNYTIKYKDKEILKNVNFTFMSGHVYLIEGNNGVGKSTFVKSLLGFERDQKVQTGSICFENEKNVLKMNDNELQILRSKVAYLEQKDDYSFNIPVLEILKDSYKAFLGKKLNKEDVEYLVRIFNSFSSEVNFDLKRKVNKLSGGQQRMLSIISSICIRKDADVFILDEPLNNLDINNVVRISNILNKIVHEKKDSVFIMITHCKIFPFVTNVLRIENNTLVHEGNIAECYACFGKPDENGYY